MAPKKILVVDDSPTIVKVVELVLSRAGYDVVSARDGEEGIEIARKVFPDLILLDFVMPKMNGYQVCKIISEDVELSDIPIVLMSAKGEQVGERFVKVMGIKDYITKPFSPEAITAVVSHTISKYVESDEENTEPGIEIDEENVKQEADDYRKEWKEILSKIRSSISREASSALVSSQISDFQNDSQFLTETLKNAFSDDFLDALIGEIKASAPELVAGDSALTGDLETIPIVEIFPLFASQKLTGILSVIFKSSKIDIYFSEGTIHLASAAGVSEEYLLGRYLVDLDLMNDTELEEFIESLPPHGLFGLQLIRQNILTEEDVKLAMKMQTKDLCYELLKWDSGRFTFRTVSDLPPIALEASLGLNVDSLLIEGFRRVDEWHLIEKEIDDFDIIFLRNDDAIIQMGRHNLMRDEITVLELVNGRHTVRDIIRKSRMGSFEVTKMLYRLLCVKLIRKRVSAVAL